MMKEIILTKDAPAPIGPYAQAVMLDLTKAKKILFCSGQIPLDPITGAVVGEGDVEAQTKQVMKNIAAVLGQAGLHFKDIIKTTIFLKNMTDFPKVNAIYGENFTAPISAARSTIEVARLPKDVLVEIEVTASA
jgi:2-iminobutanoate/2-iminopropanoate deaminase